MNKDLTNSAVVRQNVLNNTYAVEEIQKAVGIRGVMLEQSYRFEDARGTGQWHLLKLTR